MGAPATSQELRSQLQPLESSSSPSFHESATWVFTRKPGVNDALQPWTNEDACLDDQQLLELVEGLGGDETLARHRAHLEGCTACRALFSDVEGCLTRSRDLGSARDVALGAATAARRYRYVRSVGEGGMGSVVAMRDKVLDRDVAVKTLHPWLLSDANAVVRFLQEAHLMARLQGRGVPRVIDVGTNGSGLPFIVMELVDGETLAARLLRKGPLPIEEAVAVVARVCDALAIAHASGVIHRDLKPGNVMVTHHRGVIGVKLIDFGLAKVDGAMRQGSEAGDSFGTPGFMPPEQLRDAHDADARSDIWAVGVLLYRCLTGENPFPIGLTLTALDGYVPASTRRGDVPIGLDEVIARCLEPKPRLRYASAAELAIALRAATSMKTVKIRRRRRAPAKKTAPVATVRAALVVAAAFFVLGVVLVMLCW